MADYTFQEVRNIVDSEFAYDIISFMHLQEDQKYSKQIKKHLIYLDYNTSTQSVSNYLKKLRDFGMIERGKRTKRQYYKISYDGIYKFWLTFLNVFLSEVSNRFREDNMIGMKDYSEDLDSDQVKGDRKDKEEVKKEIMNRIKKSFEDKADEVESKKKLIKKFRENDKLKDFFLTYSKEYLKHPSHALYEMFSESLFSNLVLFILDKGKDKLPEDILNVVNVLSELNQHKILPSQYVEKALYKSYDL